MSFLFKPTTQTSTQQGQQQQTGSTSATSNTGVTLTPEMQALVQQLLAYGNQSMTDPTATLAPLRKAGLQQINQAYAGVPGQVSSQMASRGYGSSGAMGDAMYRTGLARAGSISGLEGQLADRGIQQQQYGASLGEQLLNSLRGSTSSTSGTSSMSGTNSGTETKPGPSIFSSLLGGVSTLYGMGGFGEGPLVNIFK